MMTQRSFLCILSIATSLAVFSPTIRVSNADTFRPVVRGRRGVVAGGQPLSVEAGMRMLQRGGNAVDAGVATILAASVIEFSHFSFGGEVPILIKLKGRDVAVVEGMGTAPAKATREFFVNRARQSGGGGTAATAPDSCGDPDKWFSRHAGDARRKVRNDSFDRSSLRDGSRSTRRLCYRVGSVWYQVPGRSYATGD